MIHTKGRWWPISTADTSRCTATVAAILEAWAARWIAHPETLDVDDRPAPPMPHARSWLSGSGIRLRMSERAWNRMLRRALDLPAGSTLPSSGHAAEIITALSAAMLADLLEAFSSGMDAGPFMEHTADERPENATAWQVTHADGDTWLGIDVDDQFLRDTASMAQTATPPAETTRRQALAGTAVLVAALAGTCHISAGELAGLAVGDVLVTETPLGQPMLLAMSVDDTGTHRPVAHASAVRHEGRIAMAIDALAPLH